MVPRLTTALDGPLLEIERRCLEAQPEIERWLRGQWQEHTPPFYGSVDLRNAGFKLAPVDMNLFPGGFNNLDATFLPLCVQAAMTAIDRICPDARRLLLIPENHTRNLFYLQNVAQLATILRMTGLEVRLGSLLPDIDRPTALDLPDGSSLLLEPLVRSGSRIGLSDFAPCAVLLNNDLSAGIPGILCGIREQFVLPPLHAGWAVRRKSNHFAAYDEVANDFARLVGIDPWRINPYFSVCSSVDFHERQGEDCLAANVDALLGLIGEKYRQYSIDETPYVVVKADAGTYGMGVMTVRDASQVRGLSRRQRNKMSVIKEGMPVSQVIIQEGVHTYEQIGSGAQEGVAEPVVYMIDRFVVGGFYRVHTGRGRDENLNAPGMHFEPLAFETSCSLPDQGQNPDAAPNRFYVYGVVARLAQLAASIELERTAPAEEPSCA
ncbi:glutamate--cysteine ligase [Accumulibacter sp.]|uniref:glutamate--cysteine ligase n=1 Tax=Accumulibacter sp. TaxID=2053492 RepID=UPI0025F5F9A0|nr:glutamate--cysteine ligase [Accumulibacter sp.]MCM8596071.1 glutamate--cysteine ligase [Accumulibacter sp.]MCM8627028.1 glutamate--cysteine ligase [Accumulibacter sp.]MDS4050220.1 glutamate--cysteine ligase [Accumulibacter sp.]